MVVMLLVTHLILGFRRLREIAYYKDDPMILRTLGLRSLPDISTISRNLSQMDDASVDNVQNLSRSLVVEGLVREQFPRLTMDFDGSVLSTKGHAQGTSVGFNKTRKGARSYYPLFCTIAQTGQFLICTIAPAMSMTQMALLNSCKNVLNMSDHNFQDPSLNPVWMGHFSTRKSLI